MAQGTLTDEKCDQENKGCIAKTTLLPVSIYNLGLDWVGVALTCCGIVLYTGWTYGAVIGLIDKLIDQ